jgi:hypothetical protein
VRFFRAPLRALTNDLYITNKLTGTVNPNNVTTGGFNPNLKSATRIDNTAPLYTGLERRVGRPPKSIAEKRQPLNANKNNKRFQPITIQLFNLQLMLYN